MALTRDEKELLAAIREDQIETKTDVKWLVKNVNGLAAQVRSNTKKITTNRIIIACIVVGGGGGIAGLINLLR